MGASTGGFTDCLLRRRAARVYALDVGRGQLAEPLRHDPRVVSLERTHVARLDPGHAQHVRLPEQASLAVIDVSFISLDRVLPAVLSQLAPAGEVPAGEIVALVKPQFEASRADEPRGVVREPAVHAAVLAGVRDTAAVLGLDVAGEIESPLRGPAGNREYLVHLRRAG